VPRPVSRNRSSLPDRHDCEKYDRIND
jgi:hypothetical protein